MCVHFLFFFIFSPPFLTLVYRCELNASTSFCFFSFSPSISFSFPLFFPEIYEIFISLFLLVAHRITIIFWREEINKIKQMFFFYNYICYLLVLSYVTKRNSCATKNKTIGAKIKTRSGKDIVNKSKQISGKSKLKKKKKWSTGINGKMFVSLQLKKLSRLTIIKQ